MVAASDYDIQATGTVQLTAQDLYSGNQIPILALSDSESKLNPAEQSQLVMRRAQTVCIRLGWSGVVRSKPPTRVETLADAVDVGFDPQKVERSAPNGRKYIFNGITCGTHKRGFGSPAPR